jgi:hypothetical protein
MIAANVFSPEVPRLERDDEDDEMDEDLTDPDERRPRKWNEVIP